MKALEALADLPEVLITRLKNRWRSASAGGWRDITVHLVLKVDVEACRRRLGRGDAAGGVHHMGIQLLHERLLLRGAEDFYGEMRRGPDVEARNWTQIQNEIGAGHGSLKPSKWD